MEEKRIKFMKIFANIPDKIRNEDIIVVLDGKPYTWNNTYFEIKDNTETGKKLLKILAELKII